MGFWAHSFDSKAFGLHTQLWWGFALYYPPRFWNVDFSWYVLPLFYDAVAQRKVKAAIDFWQMKGKSNILGMFIIPFPLGVWFCLCSSWHYKRPRRFEIASAWKQLLKTVLDQIS